MIKKYIFYLIRWQLSTPILAVCVALFASFGVTWSTIIANFVGGLIFFWVDRLIFRHTDWFEVWQVKEGACGECGVHRDVLFRLVRAPGYDRQNSRPLFLCMECSKKKTEELRAKGLKVKGKTL